MKAKKTLSLFVLGALTLSLMTGCGSNSGNMVDPGYGYNDPGYNDPGYNNPGYNDPGYNNPGYNNPGNNNPGYNNPGYGNLPVQLIATETSRQTKRGGFLFLKTYVKSITYQVSNPSQQQVQGTLKVTFTRDGSSAGMVEQPIAIPPGGSQPFTITPTMKADDATAYAESMQAPGTGTGWGNTPGTGNGWDTGSGWNNNPGSSW